MSSGHSIVAPFLISISGPFVLISPLIDIDPLCVPFTVKLPIVNFEAFAPLSFGKKIPV